MVVRGGAIAAERYGPVVIDPADPTYLGAEVCSNNTGELSALCEAPPDLLTPAADLRHLRDTSDTSHSHFLKEGTSPRPDPDPSPTLALAPTLPPRRSSF